MSAHIQPEPPERPSAEIRAGTPPQPRNEHDRVPILGEYNFRKPLLSEPTSTRNWGIIVLILMFVVPLLLFGIYVLGGNPNKIFSGGSHDGYRHYSPKS
jgi:hypothetical protein